MTCQELVELLTEHGDGALDAETEAEVIEHLSWCPGCNRYADQLDETVTIVHSVGSGPCQGGP